MRTSSRIGRNCSSCGSPDPSPLNSQSSTNARWINGCISIYGGVRVPTLVGHFFDERKTLPNGSMMKAVRKPRISRSSILLSVRSFQNSVGTEIPGNQLSRDTVAQLVPMAITDVAPEPVQISLVSFRVLLQTRPEDYRANMFAFTDSLELMVGIKQVADAITIGEILPHLRVRINLNALTQSHHDKPGVPGSRFLPHPGNQTFGNTPGIIPDRVIPLLVDSVFDARLV